MPDADIKDTNLVVYAYRTKDDPTTAGVFSIPLEVYTDAKYELKEGEGGLPKYLLSQGVVAANMRNDETGFGGFCYLLNIPALQPPKINATSLKLKPKDVLEAIKRLSNASRLSETTVREVNEALSKIDAKVANY
jgi:hypothetical protein